jgi:hypothetical protein
MGANALRGCCTTSVNKLSAMYDTCPFLGTHMDDLVMAHIYRHLIGCNQSTLMKTLRITLVDLSFDVGQMTDMNDMMTHEIVCISFLLLSSIHDCYCSFKRRNY